MFRVPLSGWIDARLNELAMLLPAAGAAALDGSELLAMRARLKGLRIAGAVSAGGGCRFHRTIDGWIALNLSRPDDVELLPALLCTTDTPRNCAQSLSERLRTCQTAPLVAQGRLLGMAIAALDEEPASPATCTTAVNPMRKARAEQPLVIDLSALWAGPLAAQLLRRGGARVIKVESPSRPDAMRAGDPALFAFLDKGKERRMLDLREDEGRSALLALVRQADVVIEAARPRALAQLGIDADSLVRERPGLAWITITGHGTAGEAAGWVAFGDDAGVAGGLSKALHDATGRIGFVGDAIADPLTGTAAACEAARLLAAGTGARVILSMSGVVARALLETRSTDPDGLSRSLEHWAAARGRSFG